MGGTWRYDSGLVAGKVPDFATALGLTADQQAATGLFCGNQFATLAQPLTDRPAGTPKGALRLRIPADGTANDDHNPPRIAPRHLFDLAVGVDNILGGQGVKVGVRVSVINLTNRIALYNFLSTFSGTHFVTPRVVQGDVVLRFGSGTGPPAQFLRGRLKEHARRMVSPVRLPCRFGGKGG